MKMVMIVLSFLLLGPLSATASAFDLQQGFEGLKWGSSPSAAGNLTELSRTKTVTYYTKPHHVYTLNERPLAHAIYGFSQNRFFAAYIHLDSAEDFEFVKQHLRLKYGKPRSQLRYHRSIFIWDVDQVRIKLKHYEKTGGFKLAYYFSPLSAQVNEARLEKGFEKSFTLVPEH